jgi:hypothetical protein
MASPIKRTHVECPTCGRQASFVYESLGRSDGEVRVPITHSYRCPGNCPEPDRRYLDALLNEP